MHTAREYIKLEAAMAAAFAVSAVKQANKFDEMMRAGRIGDADWKRYYKALGVDNFPRIEEWNHLAKSADRVYASNYLRGLRGKAGEFAAATSANGYLTQDVLNALMDMPDAAVSARPERVYNRSLSAELDPGVRKTVWGGKNTTGEYNPVDNIIRSNTKPGTPIRRHELGHWYHHRKAGDAGFKERVRRTLVKMRFADKASFESLMDFNRPDFADNLFEIPGHYAASAGGGGGRRLRKATASGWSSPWADAARAKFPKDPGVASTIEHLQRNYGVAGGSRAGLLTRMRRALSGASSVAGAARAGAARSGRLRAVLRALRI